jgi:hypothetical protein
VSAWTPTEKGDRETRKEFARLLDRGIVRDNGYRDAAAAVEVSDGERACAVRVHVHLRSTSNSDSDSPPCLRPSPLRPLYDSASLGFCYPLLPLHWNRPRFTQPR